MKVQDANFVNSLQGKAAGVTITQSAGGAGGTSKSFCVVISRLWVTTAP